MRRRSTKRRDFVVAVVYYEPLTPFFLIIISLRYGSHHYHEDNKGYDFFCAWWAPM